MMLAGEIERLDTVAGADGLVAVRLQQVVEELHVELIVLHDHDGLRHPPTFRQSRRPSHHPWGPWAECLGMYASTMIKLVPIYYGNANEKALPAGAGMPRKLAEIMGIRRLAAALQEPQAYAVNRNLFLCLKFESKFHPPRAIVSPAQQAKHPWSGG